MLLSLLRTQAWSQDASSETEHLQLLSTTCPILSRLRQLSTGRFANMFYFAERKMTQHVLGVRIADRLAWHNPLATGLPYHWYRDLPALGPMEPRMPPAQPARPVRPWPHVNQPLIEEIGQKQYRKGYWAGARHCGLVVVVTITATAAFLWFRSRRQ